MYPPQPMLTPIWTIYTHACIRDQCLHVLRLSVNDSMLSSCISGLGSVLALTSGVRFAASLKLSCILQLANVSLNEALLPTDNFCLISLSNKMKQSYCRVTQVYGFEHNSGKMSHLSHSCSSRLLSAIVIKTKLWRNV